MATVTFSNAKVVATYSSPHSMNCWAYLATGPWRKIQPISTDGTTNMFLLLNAAKASARPVTGSYEDSTGMLQTLYML